ncbi:hypothetical protein N781_14570 [Pontibacillus halophilus JSM 076056 = DSM 19796]|uniref:Uncharacterized protein n=1 Tax=Pontibacillus halophilus JSM 076056 = DSM 19796 TaxID=1385510 RepID=A0A0A5GHM6_9BACI|nr:hypothetical protein [Pontibacillus halophilus]KGX92771.1 hypothetical protein N781_14570 [Pontibacillus halophilus JSM 076056 = DSM 19796]
MNKAFLLFRLMVKLHFSMRDKDSKYKVGVAIAIMAALPLGAVLLYLLGTIVSNAYALLEPLGQDSLIIAVALFGAAFAVLFFTIFSILSSFYFSEDIESYLPMPFQPYQIIIGKSLSPLLKGYLYSTLLLGPVFFFYGSQAGGGLLYVLTSVLVLATFPIIPFILIALLMMVVMRYANIAKNKDRTKTIAGFIGILFAIGINILVRLNQSSEEVGQDLAQWLSGQNDLLWNITKVLPNTYVATQMLTADNLGWSIVSTLAFLLITAVAVALYISVGQRLYFKGVRGIQSGSKGKQMKELTSDHMKGSTPFWSLIRRDIKTIFRTPAFFIQCVVNNMTLPLLLVVILFMDGNLQLIRTNLQTMDQGHVLLLALGATIVTIGSNPTATSSISREGANWFAFLYMPITTKTVFYSKAFVAFLIQWIGLVFVGGIMIWFLQGFSIILPLWLLLSGIINWISSIYGLILDSSQPNLHWNDEQQVFRSLMPFMSLIMQALAGSVLIIILWVLPFVQGVWITFAILLSVLLLTLWGMNDWLKRKSQASLHSIK